jgi:hypothetical protein
VCGSNRLVLKIALAEIDTFAFRNPWLNESDIGSDCVVY